MKKVTIILFLLMLSFAGIAQIGIVNYDTIQSKAIQADSALWITYLEEGGDTILTIDNGKVKYTISSPGSVDSNLYVTRSYLESYIHIEDGRLESLLSKNVSVSFIREFNNRPIGEEPQVYRWANYKGNYRREGVLWGWADNTQPTTTGFELNIDNSESLTDVIIEYAFLESIKEWILKTGYWNIRGVWDNTETWNIP